MPYIITKTTLALIPKGKKTEIWDQNSKKIYSEPIIKIIEDNCIYNGSSLSGRQKGSVYLTGSSYKPPIVLSDTEEIILIPTHSVRNKSCAWINLNNILKYNEIDNKNTLIVFQNLTKITLNISYPIFDRQVMRATRLESTIRKRNKQKIL